MIRRTALIALACVALSGCLGNLLGGGKPAQLYRFGQTPAATPAAAPSSGRIGVLRATSLFQRESSGDKILAINGDEAQYIAESRWVAPANVLWDQAVLAAFDASQGRARLVSRGEQASAHYNLRLDVRNFETRYENGPKAAPVVVIRVRAMLSRDTDRDNPMQTLFEAKAPASDNRVSAIVAAYDRAVAEVLGQIVDWTNRSTT